MSDYQPTDVQCGFCARDVDTAAHDKALILALADEFDLASWADVADVLRRRAEGR